MLCSRWPRAPQLLGGLAAVAWVALKVGALSFGGGFVIIPLMQHDAVNTYHWMTAGQFLTAVALGQVTPGPVVQTVAVIGYAAAGVGGGLLASLVAFTPSFCFVLGCWPVLRPAPAQRAGTGLPDRGGPGRHRGDRRSSHPAGARPGPPVAGAILALAAGWLIGLRRGVVTAIVGAAALGVLTYLAGGPV